jgi:hypothetical protein
MFSRSSLLLVVALVLMSVADARSRMYASYASYGSYTPTMAPTDAPTSTGAPGASAAVTNTVGTFAAVVCMTVAASMRR